MNKKNLPTSPMPSNPFPYYSRWDIKVIAEKLLASGFLNAFPIGAVMLTMNAVNPATLLGYGTWVAFGAGRMPVGRLAGDPDFGTAGATGGAKTIEIDNHPTHTHTTTADLTLSSGEVQSGTGSFVVDGVTANPTISSIETPTPLVHESLGVTPIETLPPFIVVYMWHRTA